MKVIATDDDQQGTLHSKIFYSIVEQSNVGRMFLINSQTGEVMVQQNTLDREVRHFTEPLCFFSSHTIGSAPHSKCQYHTMSIC